MMSVARSERSSNWASADRVFLEHDSPDGEGLWDRVDEALEQGFQVWVRSPLLARLETALGREHDGARWLVLDRRRSTVGLDRFARIRDIALTILAIVVLAPLLLAVALGVKLSSPGPVIFSTAVVGKEGRRFVWSKFRSMRVTPAEDDVRRRRDAFRAHTRAGRADGRSRVGGKVIDRNRVTAFGGVIRKYSVDELAQLRNVLDGTMSLVGPRPCLPYEVEFYAGWRRRRFWVRPGITGVWQVFGRGSASFDEGAAMDVFYTYRRTLGFDLYLLLRTVAVVLSGSGDR